MKVAKLLQSRRDNWSELEQLCATVERRRLRQMPAATVARFATLYRAACADLALADAYQLPPNTVEYLHRLVGRAHNQLYRTPFVDISSWMEMLLVDVPRRIFNDRCVQLVGLLFWITFFVSAALAVSSKRWPDFATDVMGHAMISQLESSFDEPPTGRGSGVGSTMAGFYIQHNTGIGLQCFAYGLLVVPGLLVSISNAAQLGAAFGYMARPEIAQGDNFYQFVTAHGPFELTAIVLSAGAGLRIGMGWIRTFGLSRIDSLRNAAQDAMPLMGTAMVMFFFAALIEGFVSPSSLPYPVKAAVAVVSSGILMFYFVFLGILPDHSTPTFLPQEQVLDRSRKN